MIRRKINLLFFGLYTTALLPLKSKSLIDDIMAQFDREKMKIAFNVGCDKFKELHNNIKTAPKRLDALKQKYNPSYPIAQEIIVIFKKKYPEIDILSTQKRCTKQDFEEIEKDIDGIMAELLRNDARYARANDQDLFMVYEEAAIIAKETLRKSLNPKKHY